MKGSKVIPTYKNDLEQARKLIDIQKAYEEECLRVYNRLKIEFPDEYTHKIIIEHMSIWLLAEKSAIIRFGVSNEHWIKPKI